MTVIAYSFGALLVCYCRVLKLIISALKSVVTPLRSTSMVWTKVVQAKMKCEFGFEIRYEYKDLIYGTTHTIKQPYTHIRIES